MGFLPTNRGRRLFVSWWKYTSRPDSFARAMDAENYFFAQGESLGVFKYIPRAICCFWTLLRRRPQCIFVSNPPTFAPLVVWFYCLLFDARYAMDSHSSAFDRPRWVRLLPLHAWLARRAVWEATTNEELRQRMTGLGVVGVVVPDIPFVMPRGHYPVRLDKFTIAFVCSFDIDEPVSEVFEAAKALPEVHIYVTGNPRKAPKSLVESIPANVTLTGFLSIEEYSSLLRNVKAVMVLTTHDHTMQRGGSEAITVATPLITSDFPILRHIFPKGTLFADNSAVDIVRAVHELIAEYDYFKAGIIELAYTRAQHWELTRRDLEIRLRDAFS